MKKLSEARKPSEPKPPTNLYRLYDVEKDVVIFDAMGNTFVDVLPAYRTAVAALAPLPAEEEFNNEEKYMWTVESLAKK